MTERETTRAQVVAAVTGAGEDAAVRYAAAEAERLGAPLLVVHVLPLTLPVGPMVLFPEDSFQAHGADVLAAARSTALEAAPGLEVRTDLRAGGRVHELVAAAERAALLVVGRRASHSLDRVWTGGTLTGVVARAACPVTVVPTDWAVGPQPARVVAGFKSSQHALELLAAAFARAEQLGAELVVLHAWQLPGAYDALAAAEVPDATFNREQKDAVWRAVSETAESLPTVPVRVQVVHAPPAEALAEASRAASLLVLVRPAHGGLVHHLGRTARTVLREARCPVEIVVPTPAADAPVPPLVLEREGHLVR